MVRSYQTLGEFPCSLPIHLITLMTQTFIVVEIIKENWLVHPLVVSMETFTRIMFEIMLKGTF